MSIELSREFIIAAQLADPVTRSRVNLNQEINWDMVLEILVENTVPLISLTSDPALTACPLMRLPEFQRIEFDQRKIWMNLRDEYAQVREHFLEQSIESCLFKSSGLPPSFPYLSGNLDTLIRPEYIESGREELNELGYVELRNIEEPQKLLFRKFKGGESVSAIHLHGTVGWGVPFLDDAALWKRARLSEDDPLVLIPAPEHALLITIAHAFYENKAFKLLDIARVRHCLHQGNLNYSEIERIALQRGWEDGLAFCLLSYSQVENRLYGEQLIPEDVLERARSVVRSNAWLSRRLENTLKRDDVNSLFRRFFFFSNLLYYRKILNDTQCSFAKRWADVIRTLAWGIKLKAHISGQRGMFVSFSGIDGSGKTVHVQSLVSAFEIAEVRARIYWTRFGSSAQKSAPGHTRLEKGSVSDTATSLARRRQKLRQPVMRWGWLGYNLISLILRYNWQVRLRRWLGGVVICDRYIYDAMVEINVSLPNDPNLSRWAEWLLTHLCPRPDMAWLLDIPAELSVERQADENQSQASCEELSRQRLMYLSLAQTYSLRVVPTISRPEETTSQIVRETFLKYYDDYHTWVNALLLSNPNQLNPRVDG